jgi:hypothetical protein
MSSAALTDHSLDQIKDILSDYHSFKAQAKYDDLSDLGLIVAHRLTTRAKAAIVRISGSRSVYSNHVDTIMERPNENDYNKLKMVIGVMESLQGDIEAGYLASLEELIHGDVFADFLEMAEHLLGEGYKDAAAVIAGGTLEAHLRQLCMKARIDTETATARGTQPKRASQMNVDLAKASVYSKLDQQNVTAWLALRNNAAHGKYIEYTKEQVALFVSGIRDFITRNPA